MRINVCVATLFGIGFFLASPRSARAYCRTTTCPLPANFSPSAESCSPENFDAFCASLSPPVRPLVVWWRGACVSYDIQKNASRQISYASAVTAVAEAFAKWTGTICSGNSRVSINVRDLGPVDCDKVQYNSDQANQHVILFHDDVWPYDDSSNTLGLTTVTFDPDTGEIYDADMEINSTPSVPLSLEDPVPPDGYDFQSIITHEAGHFLGMAHSGDVSATMFAHYTPGATTMRSLTSDDMEGICVIYPPDGTRLVDPSVQSGVVQQAVCNATPRHGFQSACSSPRSSGCAIAHERESAAARLGWTTLCIATGAAIGQRRRRRGSSRDAGRLERQGTGPNSERA